MATALWFMKHIGSRDLGQRIHDLRQLLEHLQKTAPRDRLVSLLHYLSAAARDSAAIPTFLEVLPVIKDDYKTHADTLIEQGLEKGIEKGIEQGIAKGVEQGIEKGRRETIFAILDARFGSIPKIVQVSVGKISDRDTLDRLVARAATAKDLDDFTHSMDV